MPASAVRWQPKLTPYRFLVLLTTVGLGSAKAYAVSQNLNLVATSIEWVSGVLVFSILFILGLCEPNPRLLKWLLEPDLVPVVFKMFSLSPPAYRSDEGQNELEKVEVYITGYRLLTSVTVACFGIVKAYFTYQNRTEAANAFDWSFGIIIVSLLYILGLYENNTANMMPHLFFVNYSTSMYRLLWIFLHVSGICIALLFNRLGNADGVGLIPSLPSSLTPKDLKDFGANLYFFGLFLFAPYSVVVILSFRLLEFGIEYMDVPLFYARMVLQAGMGIFVFRCLPSHFWPQWINIPFRMIIKMMLRIRRNGLVILPSFTLLTLTLAGLFNVYFDMVNAFGDYSDRSLWIRFVFKPTVVLSFLVCEAVYFGLSIIFLVVGIICFFVDNLFSFWE